MKEKAIIVEGRETQCLIIFFQKKILRTYPYLMRIISVPGGLDGMWFNSSTTVFTWDQF